jgi:hypothetical protein
MKRTTIGTVAIFLWASGPAFSSSMTDPPNAQLQVKTDKGIEYVSGGFGMEERENLRAMSKYDNLELSFALQNTNYLGGADVLVKDRNGKEIIHTVSDGPLFFAKLPEGIYTVEATALGRTLEQVAHVPSKGKGQAQLYFVWKESKETIPTHDNQRVIHG